MGCAQSGQITRYISKVSYASSSSLSRFDTLRRGLDDRLLPLGCGATGALQTLHGYSPPRVGRQGAAASTTASTSRPSRR